LFELVVGFEGFSALGMGCAGNEGFLAWGVGCARLRVILELLKKYYKKEIFYNTLIKYIVK
jgi:hypothetical protein